MARIDENTGYLIFPPTTEYSERREILRKRLINNPNNNRVGDFTGRCMNCGSNNLWDDNLTYGCKDCGRLYTR
jgi:hypothetical protein